MKKEKSDKKMQGKQKWEKFIDQNIDIMIVSVLKTCSDKEHPKTINFIREELGRRFFVDDENNGFGHSTDKEHLNKRLRRKLTELCDLGKKYVGEDILDITWPEGMPDGLPLDIYRILGGRVVLAEDSGMKGKKEKGETHSNYYYFEPILSESDVHYINSAVESNHYLSKEEKDYLTARTAVAGGYWGRKGDKKDSDFGDIWNTKLTSIPQLSDMLLADADGIPELTLEDKKGKLPSEGSAMLKKIMILRYAITNKKQIEIVQGNYVPGEKMRLQFAKRNGGNKLCLNPYAMVSQKGQLYLIATCKGEKNAKHYRVDRIMALKVLDDKKREAIPDRLKENFFDKKNKFMSEDYISVNPLMRYDDKDRRIDCTFRCRADVVSVAVDNFGTKIKIEKDDYKGTGAQEYVKITVSNKSYVNVKQFLLQNCDLVTPLDPPEMVNDVRDTLMDAIKRIPK